jgi:hypothetical protein
VDHVLESGLFSGAFGGKLGEEVVLESVEFHLFIGTDDEVGGGGLGGGSHETAYVGNNWPFILDSEENPMKLSGCLVLLAEVSFAQAPPVSPRHYLQTTLSDVSAHVLWSQPRRRFS